jgi:hypothetical protein
MADTDSYDSSVNSNLASKNASAIDKMADAQQAANAKGAAGAKAATAKGGVLGGGKQQDPDAASSSSGATSKPGGGGIVGAIKNDIKPKPAVSGTPGPVGGGTPGADALQAMGGPQIRGGKDLISTDSMKGSALANDPQANLASKGRSSEYRKVFQSRGAAGKHPWGK